ncbi:hypothetical protein CYLTODRAFT_418928 [Cylindrobasidium torrendii FP15055 ss-10]|uniref:YDG domain-containing protein n=1 Tax=Cylindrobasidium torrendii FP15055 ss-10 TaxID=1314674 RepID=A0A0D7BP74_9AGAR|nr:hypothetical protein CYLTODRAFT_418928 [Cylindrobasidium torrendii FP15055 ss-10]
MSSPTPTTKKHEQAQEAVKREAKKESLKANSRLRTAHINGHIPGYPPGALFVSRADCCMKKVHSTVQGGIHKHAGMAYSICLSGGFIDDEDHGSYFYYTGCGGRSYPGYQQIGDQSWEHSYNRCLKTAYLTKAPIRVIRGHKSHYPPTFGDSTVVRYDGLYRITKIYTESGQAGFTMCKMLFQRLTDQNCPPSTYADAAVDPIDSAWSPPTEISPTPTEAKPRRPRKDRKDNKSTPTEDRPVPDGTTGNRPMGEVKQEMVEGPLPPVARIFDPVLQSRRELVLDKDVAANPPRAYQIQVVQPLGPPGMD